MDTDGKKEDEGINKWVTQWEQSNIDASKEVKEVQSKRYSLLVNYTEFLKEWKHMLLRLLLLGYAKIKWKPRNLSGTTLGAVLVRQHNDRLD